MEAIRSRPSFAGDWVAVVVFLTATLCVGGLVVRELQFAPRAAAAPEPQPSSATVPADAVSVPMLALGSDGEIRVGDPADAALARLRAPNVVSETAERGPLGLRIVRAYELAGTHFILVLEPFERNGTLRIAGIYLR